MPANNFSEWQNLPPYGVGQPGTPVQGGGGGGPQPFFRSAMDARLSMWNQTPEAQYPDGYLGTINSRRDDRLLDNLKARQNERAYQRGVHKGERIDPGDYHWPDEFNPQTGLDLEMRGLKFAPLGRPTSLISPGQEAMMASDPGVGARSAQLRRLAPGWR